MRIVIRKKQVVVIGLIITCLFSFVWFFLHFEPHLLAGDTQVVDLTIKGHTINREIQLSISDQNSADTKIVIPLGKNLAYQPIEQANASVTYDQINNQLVIDWLDGMPKNAQLKISASQSGTYVFKAQTTRENQPVNSESIAVTVIDSDQDEKLLDQGNQESIATATSNVEQIGNQDTTTSSRDSKQILPVGKPTTKLARATVPADTAIVKPADLGNQPWLLYLLKLRWKMDITQGKTTFGDLKKVYGLSVRYKSGDTPTDYSKIIGQIPAGIKYFPNLTEIQLGNRFYEPSLQGSTPAPGITGTIPNEVYGLSKLQLLYLYKTEMSGVLSNDLGKLQNLTALSIVGGSFTGTIPVNVSSLTKLTDFEFASIKGLTGSVPKELGKLVNVINFNVSNDNLSGELPSELGQLTKMDQFIMGNNLISGEIPKSFDNLKSDTYIDVRSTKLHGKLSPKLLARTGSKTLYTINTQLTMDDPQSGVDLNPAFVKDSFLKAKGQTGAPDSKVLINYANPIYISTGGHIKMQVPSGGAIQVFDKVGATSMVKTNLGLGSQTPSIGDTLLAGHSYQITDSSGQVVYDGKADPDFKLKPTTKDKKYIIRMDNTHETFDDKTSPLMTTIVIDVALKDAKVKQSLKSEDPAIGTDNNVKYIVKKPFKMISTVQNDDTYSLDLDNMTERIKASDKDKVTIDASTFEILPPGSTKWVSVPRSDVVTVTDGYQVNLNNLSVGSAEQVKLRYTVTTSKAFIDKSVLTSDATTINDYHYPLMEANFDISGELRFYQVPKTMSFADSKIASRTTEIERKLPDWKMQIEDTRLNKTRWHITANLVDNLKNSTGDGLGDSVIFKKSGQSNQIINQTNAVDIFDGTSDSNDYQDVKWTADTGPALSVAPGLAKLGSYTGTMQWTLIDAPA